MLKNKKEIFSWSFYDFANQPFTTIIVTFIYGAFFTSVICSDPNFGTLLWSWGISITAIVVAVLSPILGSFADKSGYTQHNINNQLLRNALTAGKIDENQYKRMGDIFVKHNKQTTTITRDPKIG